MLFGKNSDRQRNEAQVVEYFPRANHARDTRLTCTYITIPQVRRTHAVLLCRPFWIWGAEMGANEHGVVIGNEGLYACVPAPKEEALTGMDLLRLALERATTAAEALDVIVTLLERHGQGGNCGHLTPAYYHNSFMIADAAEAFVLETVGREWLFERVGGVRAISNEYSVGRTAERTSGGLSGILGGYAWKEGNPPNYADALQDPQHTHIGSANGRSARATSLLRSGAGQLRVENILSILRDHDPTGQHEREWDPGAALKYSLCVHAGSEDRPGQTTGSMVSEIHPANPVHWVTGTAAPCISIFKPVLLDVPLPVHGPRPTDRFDANTLWWRHERLHRAALRGNFPEFIGEIRNERDTLEADFHARVTAVLNGGSLGDRAKVVTGCWKEAGETEDRWLKRLGVTPPLGTTRYGVTWESMNRLAGMDS